MSPSPSDPADRNPTSAGALSGIRVLDLTRLLPGPFCTLLLADHGADVVKVEDMGPGDYARWVKPRHDGAEPTAASAFFVAHNRNKRSIRLDLRSAGGRDALLALVRDADVLVESFRPGAMERLGLGADVLLTVNPGLVVCPITGYGQTGPHALRSGHDLNYLALTGVLGSAGPADGPPPVFPLQVADVGGGALMAAFGIMAALRHRDRTGEGQVVDVSMADGALAWAGGTAAEVLAGEPAAERGTGPLAGGLVCYTTYACADGYVALGALEEKFWATFCEGVGRPDLVEERLAPPGSPAHQELRALFAARSRADWTAFADAHDCCLEPILTMEEALESDLVRERGMVVRTAQPGVDDGVRSVGSPIHLSATPADHHRRPAPGLGEHTDEVLREAGLGDEAIATLRADGAAGGLATKIPAGMFD